MFHWQTVVVQGGQILLPNQGAANGIIHVIDRVLEPTAGDVQTLLKNDLNYSIFSQMIENTAMNFTNITLFVPSDEAFEVMDRERLERLISNEDCVEVSLLMIIDKPIGHLSFKFHDVTESLACEQTSPLPQKKSGEDFF